MVQKTIEEARANFEKAVAYIPARYEGGIKKAEWAGPAGSDQAETNFADAMSTVTANKLRQKGVKKVSNSEWQDAAVAKGVPIIGERIRQALGKWEANFGPIYGSVLTAVKALPPRTADWRTNISQRLVGTVEAWKKAAGKPV